MGMSNDNEPSEEYLVQVATEMRDEEYREKAKQLLMNKLWLSEEQLMALEPSVEDNIEYLSVMLMNEHRTSQEEFDRYCDYVRLTRTSFNQQKTTGEVSEKIDQEIREFVAHVDLEEDHKE
ncbi:MAG: hypothetical protein Roseis2KO_53740 [Roseivirga sp.]